MITVYFQLNGDIITDAISYPHGDYVEVELDVEHLPVGINAGYYRWDGDTYAIDDELKSQIDP